MDANEQCYEPNEYDELAQVMNTARGMYSPPIGTTGLLSVFDGLSHDLHFFIITSEYITLWYHMWLRV